MNDIAVSIVIPVHNEEKNLPELYARITDVMNAGGRSCEIIFVDDGSTDTSLDILKSFTTADARVVVIELSRNFGQHAAVMAGLARTQGRTVVTIDADLQNPPEEIPTLLAAIDEGYDVVGGWRVNRGDSILRILPSRALNSLSAALFGLPLKDYGCMLRAYRREIVDQIVACPEVATYIPALANSFARRVTEVPVAHRPRAGGASKYSPLRLLRLNFDLITGFSLLPLQLTVLAGVAVACGGLLFAIFLFIRRIIVGPEVEGVFTLFAILFFFVGLQLLALGIVGEYVGRIYQQVRRRPPFVIRGIHTGPRP